MWTLQSNFTKGELDPQLIAKHDIEAYYQGLRLARNYTLVPQGGIKTRSGMEYIADISETGRLEPFAASDGTEYVLCFTNLKMLVFKAGVLQTNINGSGNSYLSISHTIAQIQDMDVFQSGDTLILLHGDVAPHKIVTTADTTWTLSTSFLTNTPQYDFNDASSPAGTAEVQQLTFTNTLESDTFKLMFEGILTEECVYSGVSNATEREATAKSIQESLQDHPLLKGKSVTVVHSAGSAFDITLDSGLPYPVKIITASFSISRAAIGPARTNATVTTAGVASSESVWSATRGYPCAGTFHEGRLYLGGTSSLPHVAWGSNVNDPFNFRVGKALDDNAVTIVLNSDKVNRIRSLFSNKTLQFFTDFGEFYVENSPITPSSISVKPQTGFGSKRIRPVSLEGTTVFIQRTGKALNAFEYTDTIASNKTTSLSFLAPHLIKDPIKVAVRQGSSTLDCAYAYIVNTDGTVTVLSSLSSQNISAFTRWETTGLIKSVCVSGDDLYFLVMRTINGTSEYYLEKENHTLALDCAKRTTGIGSDTMTGLNHLNGHTVKVRALTAAEVALSYEGGSVLDDEIVSSNSITVGATYDTIEAGLDYTVEGQLMPLNVAGLPNAFRKKRIMRCGISLYESTGVQVNDEVIDTITINNVFDAPQPFTGMKRVRLSGWGLDPELTFGRITPHRHQILEIGLEVKI